MKKARPGLVLLLIVYFLAQSTHARHQTCKPSGIIKGQKLPHDFCDEEGSNCCIEGKLYETYACSPPVSGCTKALLTFNIFDTGGDEIWACDGKGHSDDTPLVSLSSGWYSEGKRCVNNITVSGNGKRVKALVVEECVSTSGCDKDNRYQPPCHNNRVQASRGVWKALGVPTHSWGKLESHGLINDAERNPSAYETGPNLENTVTLLFLIFTYVSSA